MVRILIVGTGGMASHHVDGYLAMDGVEVVGGVDTDPERLAAFNKKYGISHGFGSVGEAIAWGQFDAASNVTPDGAHRVTTLPLLKAGKHVLCEKPLAANATDASDMAAAAAEAQVVNMMNLTYRNVPALIAAAKMVADGQIGDVRHFEASYLQSWLTQPAWGHWKTESQWLWRLSTEHGSLGVLGDVGVHILDYATFVAGSDAASVSCRLTTFDKGEGNQIGEYPLDANDSMNLHLRLTNGAVGVIHASRFASGHLNDLSLRIFGTKGGLTVKWENDQSRLRACIGDNLQTATWVDIPTPDVPTNYERFIDAIRKGSAVFPDFARGAALQTVLDLAIASDANGSIDSAV